MVEARAMEREGGRSADLTLEAYSSRLASADPVPGGGSASAVAAALGAALLSMVARLSIGRRKYEGHVERLESAAALAGRLRTRLLDLADEDAQAYLAYLAARRLPSGSPEETGAREAAVESAARKATAVPLQVVACCRELAEQVESLAGRSNLNAASDLGAASHLIEAAAQGAGANVLINLPAISDTRFVGGATAELAGYLEEIARLTLRAREVIGEGRLRDPEEE
jgi:methenyltetrahydrofolate cyclohydrolase